MMKKFWWAACITTLLALFAVIGAARAQQVQAPPTDDEVNAIASQLYCPVCENIPLDVCPTQACAEWRELIRLKLSQGWTEQQIKDYFVLQYGDRVLAVPPRHGLNWVAYLMIPFFAIIGVTVLVWFLYNARKNQKRLAANPATPPAAANEDEYIRRLEEELKKNA